MSTGTFAEILREKLQNTERKAQLNGQNDAISQVKSTTTESLELLKLKTRLLESNPQSYISAQLKVNNTPYHRFQTRQEYNSSSNEWAKTAPSAAKPTTETPKQKQRAQGLPHKLNEQQTISLSYFIEEKMFLHEDFTFEELKRAYKKLAVLKRPDKKGGSTSQFLQLKKHYETLSVLFKK